MCTCARDMCVRVRVRACLHVDARVHACVQTAHSDCQNGVQKKPVQTRMEVGSVVCVKLLAGSRSEFPRKIVHVLNC